MRNDIWKSGLLSVVCILVLVLGAHAQSGSSRAEAKKAHAELNHQYRDPEDSPLDSLDRIHFKHHHFYPIRKAYCVTATCIPTPDKQPFEMPTVSGKTKTFVQVCMLVFELHGRSDTLAAYRNLKLAEQAEYEDYLFIPFKDHSSGFKSYGGGRYIDWEMPADQLQATRQVQLDFNQCYNPYCAYSTGWNCPIPPQENYVDSKVHAGVKRWH
jgi:uncharacterized protein